MVEQVSQHSVVSGTVLSTGAQPNLHHVLLPAGEKAKNTM